MMAGNAQIGARMWTKSKEDIACAPSQNDRICECSVRVASYDMELVDLSYGPGDT
jgi:hypothetical protein